MNVRSGHVERSYPALGIIALLIAICGLGCNQPAATPVKVVAPVDPTLRVSAEDWSEFTLSRAPQSTGWVALPPDSNEREYHSSIQPQAIGLLPPGECAECHQGHTHGFLATAHARTAQVATPDSILGPLVQPANQVQTAHPGFTLETINRNSQIVHQVRTGAAGLPQPLEVPIAFVIGSGNHGQSYLAWHGDQLCQTPLSFLTEAKRWGNSPGVYRDGTADFARPATSRCLDCHNTWFAQAPGSVNRYDKEQAILGVTCVRCHGPARDHVKYHRQFPNERQPQEIVNPRNLSRERANEVCAQCHSGGGELKRPAFTYKPGEPLEKWLALNLEADDPGNDDPHAANQLGRLMRSRCYQQSGTLTCMDCHDLHEQERGRTELFSNRCQNCHQVADCGLSGKYTTELTNRCVECHMPSRRDVQVTSQGAGGAVMPLLRDHQIGIWPDVSHAIEQRWKSPAP
jgi:hypothetical protein